MNTQHLQPEDIKLSMPVIYVGEALGYKILTQIICAEVRTINEQPHVLVANIGNWVPLADIRKPE